MLSERAQSNTNIGIKIHLNVLAEMLLNDSITRFHKNGTIIGKMKEQKILQHMIK